MVRIPARSVFWSICIPRACGDGSRQVIFPAATPPYSLRVRGWFVTVGLVALDNLVFLARAGMVRSRATGCSSSTRIPRACGDGSLSTVIAVSGRQYSPRVRGWFVAGIVIPCPPPVFPARAGMVPSFAPHHESRCGIPRACGDGSFGTDWAKAMMEYSPHSRGWFGIAIDVNVPIGIFPAHVGMVLWHGI